MSSGTGWEMTAWGLTIGNTGLPGRLAVGRNPPVTAAGGFGARVRRVEVLGGDRWVPACGGGRLTRMRSSWAAVL